MSGNERTEMIVVRHGETEWNKEKIFQGQLDSPLSELGVRQAQAVADALAQERLDVIYASDLGRAVHTARIVAQPHGLDVNTDARLRERHLGAFQGLKKEQMLERFAQELKRYQSGDPDHVIPGGESSRQRYERSIACFLDIAARHAGEKILIVTHGGVLRGFLEMVLSLPLNGKRHFSLFNAGIARFSFYKSHWMMDTWGETCHLKTLGVQDDF